MRNLISLETAVECLKQGKILAFPTETSYGIAGDPRSHEAVAAVYKIKKRDAVKPLLLIASSISMVERIAKLENSARRLAEVFWPGPLTLILPRINGGEVAIRVTSSKIASELAAAFDYPIIATSANESGEPELFSPEDIFRVFGDSLPVLGGGVIPKSPPSTLIKIEANGELKVLREGAIPSEKIKSFLHESP
ncbi:MAG: L-threonylcarbamoyladenylate synthase [bacterium]